MGYAARLMSKKAYSGCTGSSITTQVFLGTLGESVVHRLYGQSPAVAAAFEVKPWPLCSFLK